MRNLGYGGKYFFDIMRNRKQRLEIIIVISKVQIRLWPFEGTRGVISTKLILSGTKQTVSGDEG